MVDSSFVSSLMRVLRVQSGLSQQQLADKIGVGLLTLRQLEKGTYPVDRMQRPTRQKIEDHFGFPLDALIAPSVKSQFVPNAETAVNVPDARPGEAGITLMKYLRERRGFTQLIAAFECGVDRATISRMESGFQGTSGMSAEKIKKMEAFYGAQVEDLIRKLSVRTLESVHADECKIVANHYVELAEKRRAEEEERKEMFRKMRGGAPSPQKKTRKKRTLKRKNLFRGY